MAPQLKTEKGQYLQMTEKATEMRKPVPKDAIRRLVKPKEKLKRNRDRNRNRNRNRMAHMAATAGMVLSHAQRVSSTGKFEKAVFVVVL